MSRIEMTNMVMIQDKQIGKVLVQDRVKSWKGLSFPGGHVEDNESIVDSAVRKVKEETGLDAGDVWFCGDNIKADVEGSAAVGIFPVWYEDETMENPSRGQSKGAVPDCDHLHIHEWLELIDVLEDIR